MKKLSALLFVFFSLLIISCTDTGNENPQQVPVSGVLKVITIRSFFNNDLINTKTYNIEENKIINLTSTSTNPNSTLYTEFVYSNNKLSESIEYFNNVYSSKREYVYNNNQLMETIYSPSENFPNISNPEFRRKVTFSYQNDLVISEIYLSSDNGISYELADFDDATIETTFDLNDNVIESKPPGIPNALGNFINYSYNENNNLISTEIYPSTIINYTYTDVLNPLALVNINTYGKKEFILTQRANSLIGVNGLSTNVPNGMSGQETVIYNIQNILSENFLTQMNLTSNNSGTSIVFDFQYE